MRISDWSSDVCSSDLEVAEVNARGGLTAAEAFFIHRAWMDSKASEFDPLVYSRVDRGRAISAADYIYMQQRRRDLIAAMDLRLGDLDALVLPTTPIPAPKIEIGRAHV